jgi:ribonuclease P protein component
MPPALARLKRRADFLRVAGAKRKWVAPGLILQARRQAPDDQSPSPATPSRVGFTVSRKVGNAVKRNRARRRLRAAVELVLPKLAADGIDFVVIGRGATLTRPFPALVKDLETALARLDALRPDAGAGLPPGSTGARA